MTEYEITHDSDFPTGLCACCEDCNVCMCSFCCPCIQFGENVAVLVRQGSPKVRSMLPIGGAASNTLIYAFLCLPPPCLNLGCCLPRAGTLLARLRIGNILIIYSYLAFHTYVRTAMRVSDDQTNLDHLVSGMTTCFKYKFSNSNRFC